MSLEMAAGWQIEVERGPEWLYVRLFPDKDATHDPVPLADTLWKVMESEFTYRLVVEMDNISLLYSHILGELVLLSRRVAEHGGLLRISGLSQSNLNVLKCTRLETYLACYDSRADAVMGHIPAQPR